MAVKVKLRHKAITGSRNSLYLDFYPPITHPETGKETRREFLNLYTFQSPKSPVDKQHNKQTVSQAEFIRQKRENELNKPEIYTAFEKEMIRQKEAAEKSFLDFFQLQAGKRNDKTKRIWETVYRYLTDFNKGDIRFADITERFCHSFKEYLLTTKNHRSGGDKLTKNTAAVYFSKLKTAINEAFKEGYLASNISVKLQGIKSEETQRIVLTLDEVNRLVQTECSHPVLKKAAIFSIYSGLRFSDIQKLTWGEVEDRGSDDFVINFKQQKTKGIEYLPISKDAFNLLGERKADSEKVFEGLKYSTYYNAILDKWIGLAGIRKDVSFHSFRHTYATLQLSLGTDIYTVSKLLGHRDLKTTQIYAKMIDENKRTAANRIQLDINNWK